MPVRFTRCVRQVLVRRQHLDHPQPRGGRLVDVVARLPAQLRLIGAQVAEQDPGLPLADVQAGELLQTLRVVAPITNGDMESEPARVGADRLQRDFVDGEAELVEAADGPLDAVAVGEAEDRLGVQDAPRALS